MAEVEHTQGIGHHPREECDPELPCPFHHPSLHPMIESPMVLLWHSGGCVDRTMGGTIEEWRDRMYGMLHFVPVISRQCGHGILHPDPDSLAYNDYRGWDDYSDHDCDGCCKLPERMVG